MKLSYETMTMCPRCERLLPGAVVAREGGVFVTRTCPEHGRSDGLVCSDIGWWENLPRFDVEPIKPSSPQAETRHGCPQDCGLCPSHRQIAGTAAIEISNRCNSACPVCIADNRSTFELSVDEVRQMVDHLIEAQGRVDAVVLSGGEPTIHPQLFDMLPLLDRPEIGRAVINSNGRRIAADDQFLDRLARFPNVYVCLHFDGSGARTIRGVDPAVQERALERLAQWGIRVAPLILAERSLNGSELGPLVERLLRHRAVRTIILSMMTYSGSGGSRFPLDPAARLTIPGALDLVEETSRGCVRKCDFIPLPMPNPMCAAIGYFLVQDGEITPLVRYADLDRVVEYAKNSNFARVDEGLEDLFRDMIDRVYANARRIEGSQEILARFRALLRTLFPDARSIDDAERRRIGEERIKSVYLMQFMDSWTFDSVRLSKCSCQHLLPGSVAIPSCGYYSYHRRFDPRFATETARA